MYVSIVLLSESSKQSGLSFIMFISNITIRESIDVLCDSGYCSCSVHRHHFVVSSCRLCEGFKPTSVIKGELHLEYIDPSATRVFM